MHITWQRQICWWIRNKEKSKSKWVFNNASLFLFPFHFLLYKIDFFRPLCKKKLISTLSQRYVVQQSATHYLQYIVESKWNQMHDLIEIDARRIYNHLSRIYNHLFVYEIVIPCYYISYMVFIFCTIQRLWPQNIS